MGACKQFVFRDEHEYLVVIQDMFELGIEPNFFSS